MELVYFRNKMNKDELKAYLKRDVENMQSMNFSDQYIASVCENTSKWSILLQGIDDPHIGRNVAILLENQRLLNEQLPDDFAQWKRNSIPIIRRAFGQSFVGYDLVSIQAMKTSQENTYSIGFDARTTTSITESRTRRLFINWDPPIKLEDGSIQYKGVKYIYGIDAEAENIAIFSKEVSDDFTREIIKDLALNAGKFSVYEYKDEAHLLSLIEGMSNYIAVKCQNQEATWVVTSPDIVKLLEEYIEPVPLRSHVGVNKAGVLNKKWQIFEDSTAPAGNILLGLKNDKNHFLSGYVFAPYLPIYLDYFEENNKSVMARYGKRLINSGFYGTIKIENLPASTPLVEEAETEELNGF